MYKKAWRKVVVLIIESIGFVFFFFFTVSLPSASLNLKVPIVMD